MSSETRTLIFVFGVLGVFSCCCMCVPVGLYVFSPAIMRMEKAVAEAQRKRARDEAIAAAPFPPPQIRPMPARPPKMPTFPPPPVFTETPPPEIEMPQPGIRPGVPGPPRPKPRPKEVGFANLSDVQRRSIYQMATSYERIKASMEKSEAQMRSRGVNTDGMKKMIADQDARQDRERQRLMDRYKITEDELKKIVQEGRDKGW